MSLIMSNSNVRINDLARELEIKSRYVLEFLRERGIHGYTHTSWVNSSLAGELRAEFSDPPGKSEREIRIEQGVIRPRAGGDPGPAPTSAFSQAPHQRTRKKKKTAKKRLCPDCHTWVPETEFEAHILKHERKTQQAAKRAKPFTKIRPGQKRIPPELRFNFIFPPMPKSVPPLPHEKLCLKCRLLVHPAAMDQHMLDHHAHPKLPDIETAQVSFMILPAGHDWDYRTVFEHYQRLSRSHNFKHNAVDWTRIEKIQKHLKPKLKSFGVRGWFGYAVYEFPYTKRIVLECPIEGNATYILWGDWQNKIHLSKGELRHRYPNQHIRVIHRRDWIEDVGRALKDR
jgi:Translation initiation factor IF-2, N-terminal region